MRTSHARKKFRTVQGKSDRVAVIGAGLAGLSAALHLAGAGRKVTVIDQREDVGGLCGRLESGGFRFDTGPTVLTMPEILEQPFRAVGETMADRLHLTRLDPAYRGVYADGSSIDVRASLDATASSIESACGPAEAANFTRFANYCSKLYEVEYASFIDRNFDNPLALLGSDFLRLCSMGGFGSLAGKVAQYLQDPRTQRLASFQALYAGMSPKSARALYAVITYMDVVGGVYYPVGGMHAVPRAMADAARAAGVTFRLGTKVTRIAMSGRRARRLITDDGSLDVDAVVITADPRTSMATLLGRHKPTLPASYSPSCLLLHLGVSSDRLPGQRSSRAHHTIHFGHAWESTFDELTKKRVPMSDPSLLVSNPSLTDPQLAPDGCESLYVLAPTPNLRGRTDWSHDSESYVTSILERLDQRGYSVTGSAVAHRVSPLGWKNLGLPLGTPFSLAHRVSQTGPFRPHNFPRTFDNVVFAGAGTTPGVGVPMVLISGRLAAARVTGPRQ